MQETFIRTDHSRPIVLPLEYSMRAFEAMCAGANVVHAAAGTADDCCTGAASSSLAGQAYARSQNNVISGRNCHTDDVIGDALKYMRDTGLTALAIVNASDCEVAKLTLHNGSRPKRGLQADLAGVSGAG